MADNRAKAERLAALVAEAARDVLRLEDEYAPNDPIRTDLDAAQSRLDGAAKRLMKVAIRIQIAETEARVQATLAEKARQEAALAALP